MLFRCMFFFKITSGIQHPSWCILHPKLSENTEGYSDIRARSEAKNIGLL